MTLPKTKFGLSDAAFHQRLAETIAWCSAQELVRHPEEDANIAQRRHMSQRAAELLSLAIRTYPSLYEQRNWISRLKDSSKIRRATKLRVEAERLLAFADPGSIDPPLRRQLRSEAFRSYDAALFQLGANRGEVVEGLAEKRASLLREMNSHPCVASCDLAGGRLLVYAPDENVEDGASQYQSKGYFDDQDAPPWDTWVCYFDRHLISWVPPSLLDLVQEGIAVNAVDCIHWVEGSFLNEVPTAAALLSTPSSSPRT
jgi:hypothetical protein